MSPENKRRLIGAIVLVAFIALLIPFLFTNGAKKHKLSDEAVELPSSSVPETTQDSQNSVAPDANNIPTNATTNNPEVVNQQQPPASPGVSPIVTGNIDEKKNSTTEAEVGGAKNTTIESELMKPTVTAPAEVGATANIEVPNNKEITETSVTTENLSPEKIEQQPVVTTKPEPTKKKELKKIKSGSWSVQVGSFSSQTRAQKMVKSLQTKGFNVYTQKINTSKGVMVRVLVGKELSKGKIIKLLKEVKTKTKINGYLVRNKK